MSPSSKGVGQTFTEITDRNCEVHGALPQIAFFAHDPWKCTRLPPEKAAKSVPSHLER
jgi:hypothetical protein